MPENSNSDREKASTSYPEYIANLAVAINQYGRGEVTIYEWLAYLDVWWDENKEAWERDFEEGIDAVKVAYLCSINMGMQGELPQIVQHSEEDNRRAYEYLLQRHPDPQWWIDQNS
jgi:hypothetical protein